MLYKTAFRLSALWSARRHSPVVTFAVGRTLALFTMLTVGAVLAPRIQAYDGIIVSELPRGGNVTVPGRFPIRIPPQTEVLLSGLNSPQAVTITNSGEAVSRVQIFAMHETKTRTLAIQPGTSTVYNFKKMKPIRVKVIDGKIEVSSLDPVKIQR